jgi:hypothetical protein
VNFAHAGMPLPLRFRSETPMSDEDLMRFCAANDALRVERDPTSVQGDGIMAGFELVMARIWK